MPRKKTKVDLILYELDKLRVGESFNKNKFFDLIWEVPTGDYFLARTLDVALCKAKQRLLAKTVPKTFSRTGYKGPSLITRMS
jgi:hypothetical protein